MTMTDIAVERIAERIMNVLFKSRDKESPLVRAVRENLKQQILQVLHEEIG